MDVFYSSLWRIDQVHSLFVSRSRIYHCVPDANDFPSVNAYMYFHSKWSMKIFSWDGAQVVPITQPLVCRNFFELNIKLFKVGMRAQKVGISFVAIITSVDFTKWLFRTLFLDSRFQNNSDSLILQTHQLLLNQSFKHNSVYMLTLYACSS